MFLIFLLFALANSCDFSFNKVNNCFYPVCSEIRNTIEINYSSSDGKMKLTENGAYYGACAACLNFEEQHILIQCRTTCLKYHCTPISNYTRIATGFSSIGAKKPNTWCDDICISGPFIRCRNFYPKYWVLIEFCYINDDWQNTTDNDVINGPLYPRTASVAQPVPVVEPAVKPIDSTTSKASKLYLDYLLLICFFAY